MKTLLLSLILLSACSSPNSCGYEVSAKFLAVTESESHNHVALFKDNTSSSVFIVSFDSRQQLESYRDYNGELSLDKHNGVFILCAN